VQSGETAHIPGCVWTEEEERAEAAGTVPQLCPEQAGESTVQLDTLMGVLLHVATLTSCNAAAIGRVGLLTRRFHAAVFLSSDPVLPEGSWRLLCRAFAEDHLLYCPEHAGMEGWRRVFLEQLLPARGKWDVKAKDEGRPETQQCDFKIQVAVRFRPGHHSTEPVVVPLHQRLRAARAAGNSACDVFSDDREPEELKCALLGGIMSDPVRLPSGSACERRVIEAQLRHHPVDPFSGQPLSAAGLVPDDVLCERIRRWRADRAGGAAGRHKLGEDQVRDLVKRMGGELPPEVIEALLEVERMKNAGQRALQDAVEEAPRPDPQQRGIGRRGDPAGGGLEPAGDGGPDEALEEEILAIDHGPGTPPGGGGGGGVRGADAVGASRAAACGDAPDAAAGKERRARVRLLQVRPPTSVAMLQPGVGVRPFIFSRVFDDKASQADVYGSAARGAVTAALNGFNACVLCYGQTGSGKTHSMFGPDGILSDHAHTSSGALTSPEAGIVLRAVQELFQAAGHFEDRGVDVTLSAQYVQIYGEEVLCLASGRAVRLREQSPGAPVLLQGAETLACTCASDLLGLLLAGEARKRRAETAMNHRSSRSHTVLAISVLQARRAAAGVPAARSCTHLYLVDLAGSERVKKSKAAGGRLAEAVGINSSLMVLGRCISALVEETRHVPYYESQLTLLLRSAFGGNSRTTAVVCCRQDDEHGDETLQALRFGERCAAVTNQASACVATSLDEAVRAIDEALHQCEDQLSSLDQRGKSGLPAFAKLQARYRELKQRRSDLVKAGGG